MTELQTALYDECIARLSSKDARHAFEYLVAFGSRLDGHNCQLRRKGYLLTYRYDRGNDVPYAFIVNRSSLLFYFRKPGLSNPAANMASLGERFQDVQQNNRGEIQLRVASLAQAKDLMQATFGRS